MVSKGMSEQVINSRLNTVFEQYDTNKDGKLSRKELTRFLQDSMHERGINRSITFEEVIEFIIHHDMNQDGEIDRR